MAKKARKRSKAKKAGRAKPRAVKRKTAARRGHKPRSRKSPTKVATAFQIMIDTINETERMRAKAEPHDSD